jgi:cysteine desulfurase/selenocysteine lyase
MIYLDNAATSWPKPEIVYQTLDRFLREKGGNPGHGSHSLAMAAKGVVDEARALMARFIQAPEIERVVFTLNCTDSINLALKGLLKAGDHVITSTLEHNALVRPLRKLELEGVTTTWLSPSPTSGVVSVEEIERSINPKTKLIAMIHASNVNGVIQPVASYGEAARKHNLVFLVDAAQTAGHFPVNVVADKIDLLAFSGHKGPLGPPGVGILYIGTRAHLDTLREGGTGIASESELQPDVLPNKYESGTVNSLGISGLAAGLKYIQEKGLPEIASYEDKLIHRLIEGLSTIAGVSLYAAPKTGQSPLISFNLRGYEPGELGAILDQAFDIKVRTGLHCAPLAHKTLGTYPRGAVRVSPGIFNTESEIDQTLKAISDLAKSARQKPASAK